jgi:hypothetical protein
LNYGAFCSCACLLLLVVADFRRISASFVRQDF